MHLREMYGDRNIFRTLIIIHHLVLLVQPAGCSNTIMVCTPAAGENFVLPVSSGLHTRSFSLCTTITVLSVGWMLTAVSKEEGDREALSVSNLTLDTLDT